MRKLYDLTLRNVEKYPKCDLQKTKQHKNSRDMATLNLQKRKPLTKPWPCTCHRYSIGLYVWTSPRTNVVAEEAEAVVKDVVVDVVVDVAGVEETLVLAVLAAVVVSVAVVAVEDAVEEVDEEGEHHQEPPRNMVPLQPLQVTKLPFDQQDKIILPSELQWNHF